MDDTEQFTTSVAPELQPSSSHSRQTGKFPLEMKIENLEEMEIEGEEEMVTIDFDPQEGEVIEEVVGQTEGEMGDINEEHPPNLEKMIDFNVSGFVFLRFFSSFFLVVWERIYNCASILTFDKNQEIFSHAKNVLIGSNGTSVCSCSELGR